MTVRIICPYCGFCKEVDQTGIPAKTTSISCPVCKETFRYSAVYQKKASFFLRTLALLIDQLLVTILSILISFVLDHAISRMFDSLDITAFGYADKLFGIIIYLVMTIVTFSYYTWSTSRFGRTAGKYLMGIRVVTENGAIPSIDICVKREVAGKLLSALLIGAGFLWVLFDRNNQALHDRIAGTYVVYS